MNESGILAGGTVVTGGPEPLVIEDGAVAWDAGRITAVGPAAEVRAACPDLEVLDAGGGLILPGLVNLHHHFYSALARGLDPGVPMADFAEVLDRLWWRLDRSLDLETVRLSAELSLAECIRHGCTTVFDHHASPSAIAGGLETIAGAVERAGLSSVLCYEVTDRNGADGCAAGIEENLDFIRAHAAHPRIRGVLGLHASFTVSDATLATVAQARPDGAGCHVHVAEDPIDVEASMSAFDAGPVQRLQHFGLLDERALLAHGIHLQDDDYTTIARYGSTLIHNPESNANNGVGRLDVERVADLGVRVGLGTDGMSSSMLRALRFAFLNLRGGNRDPAAGFAALPSLLTSNAEVARVFFDEPTLGLLVPGAPADLIAVDSPAPTPLTSNNLFGHLVYGVSEAPVRHTVARGRVLLRDFQHATLDPAAIAREARERTPELWRRFHALEWGTPYLG